VESIATWPVINVVAEPHGAMLRGRCSLLAVSNTVFTPHRPLTAAVSTSSPPGVRDDPPLA
jgi:hypothetical protein